MAPIVRRTLQISILLTIFVSGVTAMAAGTCRPDVRQSAVVDAQPWSAELIIRIVRFLDSKGVDVTATGMANDKSAETAKLIYRISGRRVKASSLLVIAKNYFTGGWVKVLEQSRVRVGAQDRRTLKTGFWNPKVIIEILQWLDSKGVDLEQSPLLDNSLESLAGEMQGRFGKVFNGSAIVQAAKKKPPHGFGSLGRARKAAGLQRHTTRIQWSEDLVLISIRAYFEAGISLQAAHFQKKKSENLKSWLLEEHGIPATPAAVYKAAVRRFTAENGLSAWEVALLKTGINPLRLRRQNSRPWTENEVLDGIRALHEDGRSLYREDVETMNRASSMMFFFRKVGHGASAMSLVGYATSFFGSWYEAVRAAGIDPAPYQVRDRYWSRELVVRVIQELARLEYPLNAFHLMKDNSLFLQDVLFRITGRRIVGRNLISAANTHFLPDRVVRAGRLVLSSWDAALTLAGQDPVEVRKKQHHRQSLFDLDTHTDRIQTDDGGIQYVTFLGKAQATPEEIMLEREREVDHERLGSKQVLDQMRDRLEVSDRQKVEDLLDYLSLHESLDSLVSVNEWMGLNKGWQFKSQQEFMDLLERLRESET
ncbi:MAG: hypothetical protein H6624_16075 [Bdellovibrionaceae bacterium]|nr:hypothetical protein [Bdellovibrionales bacterium]MCB9085866.1 hypothetical protein [Pseudobdellovibrionaceae bacterium]